MKRLLIVFGMLMVLWSCTKDTQARRERGLHGTDSDPCKAEYDAAAVILNHRLGIHDIKPLDRLAESASIRKWAETLSEDCVRWTYLEWLDYYDNVATREIRTAERVKTFPMPPGLETK